MMWRYGKKGAAQVGEATTAEVRRGIAQRGQAFVSEATGFDQGEQFTTHMQVSEFFTVAEQEAMHGDCPWTQAELDVMADAVIANGWHYAGAAVREGAR